MVDGVAVRPDAAPLADGTCDVAWTLPPVPRTSAGTDFRTCSSVTSVFRIGPLIRPQRLPRDQANALDGYEVIILESGVVRHL